MLGQRPGNVIFCAILVVIAEVAVTMTLMVPVVAAEPACDVPGELMEVDVKLHHLGDKLKSGGPLTIVAIGGASTAGLAAGSADLAYPQQMKRALARWYPAVPMTVVNKSLPHQTAEQMLARFPRDVFAEKPVLVIWETGTTDAVRGVDVDAFAATVQDGIDAVAAQGADLILVDLQFSRKTDAVIDLESYLDAIHRVGDLKDVYVFPRFALMRYWSEQEVFDLDGVERTARTALAKNVYKCLGRQLADAIRTALQ